MDAELSPLVQRSLLLTSPQSPYSCNIDHSTGAGNPDGDDTAARESAVGVEMKTVLRTVYKATTNRMLRVAVNGFMESLGVVLAVMEELDVDVLLPRA